MWVKLSSEGCCKNCGPEIVGSLDSNRPDVADQIFGTPGHLHKVVASIRTLVDAGVFTRTNTILTPYNVDHVEDSIEFLADLGITDMKIAPSALSLPLPRSVSTSRSCSRPNALSS